jgi:hypothetical protein
MELATGIKPLKTTKPKPLKQNSIIIIQAKNDSNFISTVNMIYDAGLNNIILKKLQRKGMESEFTLGVPAETYIPIDDETLVLKQIKLVKYEQLDNTAVTWLKSEQGKLKSLERSSFKRLLHLSNKTLKQLFDQSSSDKKKG